MSYNLFLDDERFPEHVTWKKLPKVDWVIVRNYYDFVDYIQTNGLPDFVTFDADLSFSHYIDPLETDNSSPTRERDGVDCFGWLCNYCSEKGIKFPSFELHTMNSIKKDKMEWLFIDFKKQHPKLV